MQRLHVYYSRFSIPCLLSDQAGVQWNLFNAYATNSWITSRRPLMQLKGWKMDRMHSLHQRPTFPFRCHPTQTGNEEQMHNMHSIPTFAGGKRDEKQNFDSWVRAKNGNLNILFWEIFFQFFITIKCNEVWLQWDVENWWKVFWLQRFGMSRIWAGVRIEVNGNNSGRWSDDELVSCWFEIPDTVIIRQTRCVKKRLLNFSTLCSITVGCSSPHF